MRSPKWRREEIILALDLYFQLSPKDIKPSNPKIIELSKLLNKLSINSNSAVYKNFRNPNGVNMKLANFKSFDPEYSGSGLAGGSKLDKVIFDEFYDKKNELNSIASGIRSIASNSSLLAEIYNAVEEEEVQFNENVKEGKVIFRLHKLRERNSKLTRKKKEQHLKKYGRLECEVCDFDFYEVYGEVGLGYIEAHHRTPLSEINGESITTLKDLALVCSNCHRMLHRQISTLSVEELKASVSKI